MECLLTLMNELIDLNERREEEAEEEETEEE